jgi:hypothetical protein
MTRIRDWMNKVSAVDPCGEVKATSQPNNTPSAMLREPGTITKKIRTRIIGEWLNTSSKKYTNDGQVDCAVVQATIGDKRIRYEQYTPQDAPQIQQT